MELKNGYCMIINRMMIWEARPFMLHFTVYYVATAMSGVDSSLRIICCEKVVCLLSHYVLENQQYNHEVIYAPSAF